MIDANLWRAAGRPRRPQLWRGHHYCAPGGHRCPARQQRPTKPITSPTHIDLLCTPRTDGRGSCRSLADLQADGTAPSWLVRVGTRLALHFPGGNLRPCLDRPGRLIWEPGRRLFAILPGPAAKQTHSAAKETHSVIIGRRLADFSYLGLRGRSAGRSKVFCACQRRPGRVARPPLPR